MTQNQTEDPNNNNSNNASPPQNITYITTIEPGQQNATRVVSHRRTISIVSQSTISAADVFLTPQSIRHADFVKQQEWLANGHKRSASASSFFSVVSEKDKTRGGAIDNSLNNALVVDVRNGFVNHGYVNGEGNYVRRGSQAVMCNSTTREQYWACKNLSSREKIFCSTIFLLILIILGLISVILYMHYRQSDKNISQMLPPWLQSLSPPSVQR